MWAEVDTMRDLFSALSPDVVVEPDLPVTFTTGHDWRPTTFLAIMNLACFHF
jgi:hypothetical protein